MPRRLTKDNFDCDYYRKCHHDVRHLDDYGCWKHWCDYGKYEGRKYAFKHYSYDYDHHDGYGKHGHGYPKEDRRCGCGCGGKGDCGGKGKGGKRCGCKPYHPCRPDEPCGHSHSPCEIHCKRVVKEKVCDPVDCKPLKCVTDDIVCDTVWSCKYNYIITNEVHVKCGARLCIQPCTNVYFKSGPLSCIKPDGLRYASLVVDSGASIDAECVKFRSESDAPNQTGGLIIVGTLRDDQFENYKTVRSRECVCPGRSRLVDVEFNKVGNRFQNLNSLTIFNIEDDCELCLSKIKIVDAGDDGIEILGGDHNIDQLEVYNALGDGVDLDEDARLRVHERLVVVAAAQRGAIEILGSGTNVLRVKEGAELLITADKFADKAGAYTQSGSFDTEVADVNGPVSFSVEAEADTLIKSA
jgi:hypothetical protein